MLALQPSVLNSSTISKIKAKLLSASSHLKPGWRGKWWVIKRQEGVGGPLPHELMEFAWKL